MEWWEEEVKENDKKFKQLWNKRGNLIKKVLGNDWEQTSINHFKKIIDDNNYEIITGVMNKCKYIKKIDGYDGIVLEINTYLFTFEYLLEEIKKLGEE